MKQLGWESNPCPMSSLGDFIPFSPWKLDSYIILLASWIQQPGHFGFFSHSCTTEGLYLSFDFHSFSVSLSQSFVLRLKISVLINCRCAIHSTYLQNHLMVNLVILFGIKAKCFSLRDRELKGDIFWMCIGNRAEQALLGFLSVTERECFKGFLYLPCLILQASSSS
jgi:hypothetical protein